MIKLKSAKWLNAATGEYICHGTGAPSPKIQHLGHGDRLAALPPHLDCTGTESPPDMAGNSLSSLLLEAPTSLSLPVQGKNTLSKLKRKPACCSPRAAHNWVGMMPQTTKCSRWLQASSSLGWQSWNKRKTEGRECIFCAGLLGRGWTLAQSVHHQHTASFQLFHCHTNNDQIPKPGDDREKWGKATSSKVKEAGNYQLSDDLFLKYIEENLQKSPHNASPKYDNSDSES